MRDHFDRFDRPPMCMTDLEKKMYQEHQTPVNYRREQGSLTLRSNDHVYRRGVYVDKWYPEEDPKDFDFKLDCPRTLFRSTYRRFAEGDKPTPESVYTALNDDMFHRKAQHLPALTHRFHLSCDEKLCSMIDQEKQVMECSNSTKNIVPRHPHDHKKIYDLTTNVDIYRPQLPLIETENIKQKTFSESGEKDKAKTKYINICNRKPVSQFTDLDGRKRDGWNTWMDESGIYFNTLHRMKNPFYFKFRSPYRERK